jgi:steroid Delta-isomerase
MVEANASAQAAGAALAVYEAWHERARARDVPGLLALYAPDALLESPLVPRILGPQAGGVLRGHEQIGRFLRAGTERRPNELVRWHRSGEVHWNGRTLVWEYPRVTPDGDQGWTSSR